LEDALYSIEKGEESMKKIVATIVSFVLLLSVIPLFFVHALPANSMWIEPTALSFSTTTTSVGHKFNVTIWLNMTTPTNNWQFYLIYNKNHLKALRCDYTGNFKSMWSGATLVDTVTPGFGSHNSTHNYVVHAEVLKSSALRTGAGSLSWIEFNITKAPGEGLTLASELRLDVAGVFESNAFDADFNPIPLAYGNATYTFSSPWTPPPPATISVKPAKIVDPLLTPCHNFTVNVTITGATGVYSFTFKLGFDKNVITAVEAQLGDFFPPSTVPTITINNAAGFVIVSAHLISLPTVSGNGTLAWIKFHVEAFGPSTLHLSEVVIKDDVDRTLPSNTADGYFNNVLLAKLYVDPPEIIDPTLVPPKTFDVNVTLDDVENLYGYEFNMSFNKNVLTCLYIIVHDVMGETNYVPETQVSNSRGFIWVRTTYFPPAVPITTYNPVALVTVHFRVRYAGVSVLDLHDTSLTNSTGGQIPHEVTDGFVQTLIHDVAITDVTPASSWAYAGWPVEVVVKAKNLGNASEAFTVTAYANTTAIGAIGVLGLIPGGETLLNFTWNTTGFAGGVYIMSANASIVPFELNTGNNRFVDGQVTIMTVKHDVAITEVTPEVSWAYQGWIVKINVTASNLGGYSESFNVTTFYDSTPIGKVQIPSLAANTSVKLTFNWNTTTVAFCHNYTIHAEATLVPFEYNVTNNSLIGGYVKVRIVGDINGDGKVDVTDIAMVSAAFGSYPGHPRWNPACDINRDNRIDVQDLAKVSKNFGKYCPP
jgi:hypothetical protein